jgi:hypothetical protein
MSVIAARPAITAAVPPPPASTTSSRIPISASATHVQNTLACGSKMLMIQGLNGVKTGVTNPDIIFTPDPQFDDYKITGCNFGTSQGQAHLNGPFRAGQVRMQIEYWSDTMIEMKVDPNLTGELDQKNVTLVIAPTNGPQAQLQGCKFYALRKDVELTSISQNTVTLAQITDTGGGLVKAKFTSPYTALNLGGEATGASYPFGVDRFATNRFGFGQDVWDFSNLAPGFVPVGFSLNHWALDACSSMSLIVADATVYDDGQWSAQWDPANPRHLIVNFAEQHCHATDGNDASDSSYAINVTVNGPVGVNPVP